MIGHEASGIQQPRKGLPPRAAMPCHGLRHHAMPAIRRIMGL
ncbi:hypothetical protein [Frigidibacter sp. ROC022]|nr:hypothetical protein [Frigidibacter sp. ROC022]MCR8723395.1 hypothetical protein [Frigidibacter sp. ROC022]